MSKVSVIIPTFNERDNILPLIQTIRTELKDLSYEILVVDDQSPDGTAQLVVDLKDPAVRVLSRSQDHGYAKAIRYGIEQVQGELLIVMDSDFNHDPRYIPSMIEMLSQYDCVSASRFLKGGRMVPAWRGVASRIFNAFVRQATGGKLTDNLYGFFGFRREVLTDLSFEDIFFGFGDYGIRFLFYLQKKSVKIIEFPAVYARRKTGRGNHHYFRTLCQYVKETRALAAQGRIQ